MTSSLCLKGKQIARRIQTGVNRAEGGNLGDHSAISHNIFEMKILHLPEFRIFFKFKT